MSLYSEIEKKCDEIQNTLENNGFPKFSIDLFISEKLPFKTAGLARYNKWCGTTINHTIILSAAYLREFAETVINEVLLHEMCHHYVGKYFPLAKQAHGPEFRKLMNILGLPGNTYHTMRLSNAPEIKPKKKVRYIYESEKTKEQILLTRYEHNKQMNGERKYFTKTTGEALIFTGQSKILY